MECYVPNNTEGGSLGTSVESSTAAVSEAGIDISNPQEVTSYGGFKVDMSGDWSVQGPYSKIISKEYDYLFKKAGKETGIDWRLCAALCYEESKFKKDARSHKGARGLWQFLRGSWPTQLKKKRKTYDGYVNDPEVSTEAFILSMKPLLANFKRLCKNPPTKNDIIALSIQSYHDGWYLTPQKGWAVRDLRRVKNGKTDEAYEYLQKIIKKYKEYCK